MDYYNRHLLQINQLFKSKFKFFFEGNCFKCDFGDLICLHEVSPKITFDKWLLREVFVDGLEWPIRRTTPLSLKAVWF